MKTMAKPGPTGFTLVEVIITLLVAAIFGTMMFSVLGSSSVTKSSEPIRRMKETYSLQQVMENFMTAYYEDFEYLHALPELKTAIDSRALDPVGRQWNYTIVENRFIKFDANRQEVAASVDDPDKMLKVTIKYSNNENNETLTYVFAP